MGDKTGISWTDSTWNPIVGCSIVSPACTNCYAMSMAARLHAMGVEHYRGLSKRVNGKNVWIGKVVQAPEHILFQPLRWKRPRRIFVNSMSDLFHENVPDEWIDRIFAVMALAPQHTFQILTKRPARMRAYLEDMRAHYFGEREGYMDRWATPAVEFSRSSCAAGFVEDCGFPLPNVWLGVTAEDQIRADERIPELLATPAAKRFVSVEPMLGPVNLRMTRWATGCPRCEASGSIRVGDNGGRMCPDCEGSGVVGDKLDWVICGGESGPSARPMHPKWARFLRDQCKAAGTAFFFKQWGEWAPADAIPRGQAIRGAHGVLSRDGTWRLDSDIADPPEHVFMFRVGKKAAGDRLDGIEHKEFPA